MDYHYERSEIADVFPFIESTSGEHKVPNRKQLTKPWGRVPRYGFSYLAAKAVSLICDYPNTSIPAAYYETLIVIQIHLGDRVLVFANYLYFENNSIVI